MVSFIVLLIGVCKSFSCSISCEYQNKTNLLCSNDIKGNESSAVWKSYQVLGKCNISETCSNQSEVTCKCSFAEEELNIALAKCEPMWFTLLVSENLLQSGCNEYYVLTLWNNETIFLNITRQDSKPLLSTALSTSPFQTSEKYSAQTMSDTKQHLATSAVSSPISSGTVTSDIHNGYKSHDYSSRSDSAVTVSVLALLCSLGICAYLIGSKLYEKHKKHQRGHIGHHGSDTNANQGRALNIVHLPPPLPTPQPPGNACGPVVSHPQMIERVNSYQTQCHNQGPRLSLESSFNSSTREASISVPFGAIAESSRELDICSPDLKGRQWEVNQQGQGELYKPESERAKGSLGDNENIYCTMEDLSAKTSKAHSANVDNTANRLLSATPTVVDCTYVLDELPGCSTGGALPGCSTGGALPICSTGGALPACSTEDILPGCSIGGAPSGSSTGDALARKEPDKKKFQRNVRFIPEGEDDYVSYSDLGCTIYANMPLPRLGPPKRPTLDLTTTPSLPPPKEFTENGDKQPETNETNISEL